jgi:hypothetical protein
MAAARTAHPPLSERLPAILAYPSRSPTLWLIGALALVRLLHHLPNVLGLLFEIAFWFMAFKLAVEALRNTSEGRYEPVDTGDVVATDGEAWDQILLQFLFAIPIWVIEAYQGPLVAALAASVAAVFMPAAIMIVAIDRSVLHALNPLTWLEIMRRVGRPYFAAVTVFELLLLASALADAAFAGLPNGMGVLPASIVAVYALVAAYHLLGDVLHRHHAELGLDIAPAIQRATYANPFEDEAMAAADELARDGQPAEAAAKLQDLFRGRGASDPVHERYRELLIAAGDLARLAQHDREYVAALLATGKDKRALAVFVDTGARVADFRLDADDCVARLVAQALRTSQTRLAVTLADEFEARFPASPHVGDVLLGIGWPMADKLGLERQAIARVRAALARSGGAPRAEELRELLSRIQQLPSA